MWYQKSLVLKPRARGFHLITREIVSQLPEIQSLQVGLLHLFLRHTSASITINENADPTVRADFESLFSRLIPEDQPYYQHTLEGPDDLPAHIKSSLLSVSLSIPIGDGELALGTWQGIYLGEHRNHGGARTLTATIQGD